MCPTTYVQQNLRDRVTMAIGTPADVREASEVRFNL